MRDALDLIGVMLLIAFTLGLFFVFSGDPDLWDKWHAQAMSTTKDCK